MSDIRATIAAYLDALNRGDIEAICALYAEDATVEDPVGSPVIQGIEAIRAFYERSVAARPELEFLGDPVIVGAFSATPLRASVHFGGRDITIDFISVMSFRADGKVGSMTAYFDASVM